MTDTLHPPPEQLRRLAGLRAWLAAHEVVPAGAPVELIETHISWVLLTPSHAYKLKKAVDLGFIDQRSLAARRHACEEELRLNRRTAPALYLGVVDLDAEGVPHPAGTLGPSAAQDHAVMMRRFDPAQTLDRLIEAQTPQTPQPDWPALVDALVDQIVALHAQAQRVHAPGFGLMADLHAATGEAPVQWLALAEGDAQRARLQGIVAWLQDREAALDTLCRQRREAGFVRELHGDLHLGNVCLFEGRVTVFDGIDFNAGLRSLDVMNDLAFLLMDLRARGADALAWRALSRYLDATGDHGGLPILPMCMVWRALVRFKVARLQDLQGRQGRDASRWLAVCERLMHPPPAALVLMHGLSGCGKTALSQALLGVWGAVRLRSDVERSRTPPVVAPACATPSDARYAAAQVDAVYAQLRTLAEDALRAGQRVILDATFLDAAQRQAAISLAERLGCPWGIVHVQASLALLRERIAARRTRGDASEADEAVLAGQWARHGDGWADLGATEQAHTQRCDATLPLAHWQRPEAWSDLWAVVGP